MTLPPARPAHWPGRAGSAGLGPVQEGRVELAERPLSVLRSTVSILESRPHASPLLRRLGRSSRERDSREVCIPEIATAGRPGMRSNPHGGTQRSRRQATRSTAPRRLPAAGARLQGVRVSAAAIRRLSRCRRPRRSSRLHPSRAVVRDDAAGAVRPCNLSTWHWRRRCGRPLPVGARSSESSRQVESVKEV